MKISLWRIGSAALAAGLLTATAAFAQQPGGWAPELLQPASGVRTPTDPLRVRVRGASADTLPRLVLELDDMDVTSMISMENDVGVFSPPQPLAYGEHQLRLVEQAADGSILERGQWTFEVRRSARLRDAQLQGNVTLKAGSRVAQSLPDANPPPGRFQADGGAQFQGAASDGDWRATGAMSLIANHRPEMMPRRRGQVDLGQFLVAADSGMYGLKLGDHAVGPDSLVLQSFARRGASASVTAPTGSAALSGFSMHATPLTGFQHGLGMTDKGDRVDGIIGTLRPFDGNADALTLTGSYVNGEGQSASPGVSAAPGAPPATGGGSAASLVADSNLWQRKLRLRGEFAASSYDFDGAAGALAPQSGHAASGLAMLTPWHDATLLDKPLVWNVGVEKKRISSLFRSPANPAQIGDRDMTRAFTGLNWYGMDMQLNAGREFDNVDENLLVPRTGSRQRGAMIAFTPLPDAAAPQGGQPPELPWYGRPSLNASYTGLTREIVPFGAVPTRVPLHSTTSSTATAAFQYASWNWNLTRSDVRDRSEFAALDPTPTTRNRTTRLQGNFRLFERVNLTPNAFRDHIEDRTTLVHSRGAGGGLNLVVPIGDTVNTNLAYAMRHGWKTDGSEDGVTRDLTVGINWILQPPRELRPGLALALDGSRHQGSGIAAGGLPQPGDSYQLFLRFVVNWVPSF